jgi:hypothetical protein
MVDVAKGVPPLQLKSRGVFTIAATKIGKQNNRALRRVRGRFGGGRAGVGLAVDPVGKPPNKAAQMLGHAFVDDMLPVPAKLVGDGGLLGAAQSHDVVASL